MIGRPRKAQGVYLFDGALSHRVRSKSAILGIGLLALASLRCAAGASSPSGDAWVTRGLTVTAGSLGASLIGGNGYSIGELAVASGSMAVAYPKFSSDLASGTNRAELWLMDRGRPLQPELIAQTAPGYKLFHRFQPSFSADGKIVAYLADGTETTKTSGAEMAGSVIALRDIAKRTVSFIRSAEIPPGCIGPSIAIDGFRSYALSPDATRLAVVAVNHVDQRPTEGLAITIKDDPWSVGKSSAAARLLVLDLTTGMCRTESPPVTNVSAFDWSPDGTRIAFSGSVDPTYVPMPYMFSDVFLTDLRSGLTKPLVVQPGLDSDPHWSPDGKWIAFKSQRGEPRWLGNARLGVYRVDTGGINYPAFDQLGAISGFGLRGFQWAPDSQTLLLSVAYQLTFQFFKLSVADGKLTQFTNDSYSDFYEPRYADGGRSIVFLSQSFLRPPNIFFSSADTFGPRQLTAANPDPVLPKVEVRNIAWPSADKKWVVHGWLLLPIESRQASPLPLLVYAEGGPDMVSAEFGVSGYGHLVHALLANGVAVLIPNSRGRAGYGTAFEAAWGSERDFGEGPLEDDISGIDSVVQAGLIDGTRVGLVGHSWGGYLAAYALTHSGRFKAIIIHEAVSLDALSAGARESGIGPLRDAMRQMGMGAPFKEEEANRLRNLSPIYEVEHASTPSLLEFGAESSPTNALEMYTLFSGLKYFNKAPAELIEYPRSGHVFEDPTIHADAARRELEWYAYWVLGKPTQRMIDKYGKPPMDEWKPGS